MRATLGYRRRAAWAFVVGFVLWAVPQASSAQPYPTPDKWGGDILSRPRLTGDWGGLRDDLAKKGVLLDVDLLATPQAVVSGGRSTGANFWANMDYTLNIDTQKLGLWPGGFFKFEGDTGLGSNIFHDAGTFLPVNTAALFPASNDRTTALTTATFTQFLSPQIGFFTGKINVLELGETEFYGDYRTQFQNTALNFPLTLNQVPLSSFGGGIIGVPQQDIVLSAMALGANGTATSDSVSQAFNNGVVIHEDVVEMYYSAALAPWLTATGDLQIINSGLNKALNASGQLVSMDRTVVTGVRLRVRF
jgi:porin